MADAGPLDVNPIVTFEEVRGLDDRTFCIPRYMETILMGTGHRLPEGDGLLSLIYPELFQRFNLTSPSSVLFYGSPGTGKMLLVCALAAIR